MEGGVEYTVLEGSERPGGLCRTETVDGFSFDYTGHLLHLKERYSRDLILEMLGHRLVEHNRRASVCIEGTFVPYPVQAHFGKLPAPVAERCMEDLIKVSGARVSPRMPFPEWTRAQFGSKLAEIFMIPYNSKLYVHPLGDMEVSWTSWAVPKPTIDEIKGIAAGRKPPAFGYNTTFFYPERGGIEILPEALGTGQEERIRTTARVAGVNVRLRTVTLHDGEMIPYDRLISTMPLPDLIGTCEGLSAESITARSGFRHSSVLGICIGLDRPISSDDHWIYFPDEKLPFYRIGFPSNFSGDAAPEGCGSLYTEVAYAPGSVPDADSLAEAAMRSLKEYGLVDRSAKIAARLDLYIPWAYVFHDRHRIRHIDAVLAELRAAGILSIGRYGAWEYSAMQDAVDWGLKAAREIMS
jgi:protoporphyrinogen oxidase